MISMLIAGLSMAIFFGLSELSIGRNLPESLATIRSAFLKKDLVSEDYLVGDTVRGRHQFNDCLILGMAVDQGAPRQLLAIAPAKPIYGVPAGKCADLNHYVTGDPPSPKAVYYYQYLHGATILVRYLLPSLSVRSIRELYKNLVVLTIFAGISAGMIGLMLRRRIAQSLFWIITFIVFLRFFGLESFDQSLGHGPADLVLMSYALFLSACSLLGGIPVRWISPTAAIFGTLTIIFELLTGGVHLGLGVLIGGLPFALRSEEPAVVSREVLVALTGFLGAIGTCILIKVAVEFHFFGITALQTSSHELIGRAGFNNSVKEASSLSLRAYVAAILRGFDALDPGSSLLGILTTAIALIAGCWGYLVLRNNHRSIGAVRAKFLLLSNVPIGLLLLGLWQHTIVHSWFMDRVFVWTIASGFGIFATAVTTARGVRFNDAE
jgi:hypothetical protein